MNRQIIAIVAMTVIGVGILIITGLVAFNDGKLTVEDAGWGGAALLALRDVMSKIEKIASAQERKYP